MKASVQIDDNSPAHAQHQEILESLRRLAVSLTELDEKSSSSPLTHYQKTPHAVQEAHRILQEGANLIHATATKYALMGKINEQEQTKIAQDLLRGCQLVGTAAFLVQEQCGRSARTHSKRTAQSIVTTVLQLVESFVDHSALCENVGAQKTGAVWQSCDSVKFLPMGNRNAMRRDLFMWMKEAMETMEEFQELLDHGVADTNESANASQDLSWDDFCGGQENEQYSSEADHAVASACLKLIKCSRGSLNMTMKAMEAAGEQQIQPESQKAVLTWIGAAHEMARKVGVGLTDLGALLYPPIEPTELREELERQYKDLKDLQEHVLGASAGILELPNEVVEMATRIRANSEARYEEAISAFSSNK